MMFKAVGLGQVMVALGFLLTAFVMVGCGDVMLATMPDAGDMGEAGSEGSMGGAGGGPGGTAGAGDVGGSGGAPTGGTTGTAGAPACEPDVCTYCVDNVRIPKPDGTRCGPGLCDGVLPYVGQGGCVTKNQACQAGMCVTTTVDCCRKCATPGPQSRCTADAPEDPTVPSFCTACVF